MKKLPILLALALLGACGQANPTTSADDTDKSKASFPDRASAPPTSDSTAASNVSGTTGTRMTDADGAGAGLSSAPDQAPAEDPANPGASVTPDANFVNSALADGQYEIQSSQRLLKDTKDARLREFAELMIRDHTKAGDELRRTAAKLGMNVTDRLTREQTGLLGRMEKLTGQPLQTLYLDGAVKGHNQAVNLFRTASQSAGKPDLQQFARKYLPTIEHHAEMAKALRGNKPLTM